MTGTILNVITVLIGGTIGLFFGARFPERVRQTVIAGIGLFTAAYGIQKFFTSSNILIVLGSLLIGGILGEWWQIEKGLQSLGAFLERKFAGGQADLPEAAPSAGQSDGSPKTGSRFVRGFLTASLVFCVGPLTILGSISDGLTGDYSDLAIKSVLDGFAAMAFAATLGVGVLFSVVTVLVVQGSISLLAAQVQAVITPPMLNEMTAVGGLLLLGLAISSLLEIRPIRVGNFLPALGVAPLIVALLTFLGISP
ncbi:MAG TPA: DUF554 domain-containing protein [Chloroflexi bacterium]|nr:DUF554 domain-containing protein [Chloroflexota bacterium]